MVQLARTPGSDPGDRGSNPRRAAPHRTPWKAGRAVRPRIANPRSGVLPRRAFDPRALRTRGGAWRSVQRPDKATAQVRVPGDLQHHAPVVQRTRCRPPKPAIQVRLLAGALLPLRCNRLHARLLTGRTRFEPWWGSHGERAGAQVTLARSPGRVRPPCSPPRTRVAQRPERLAHTGEAPGSSPGMRTTVP